jgi:chromate transporter
MSFTRVRYIIFLRDVLILSVTSFGGPTAHLAMFLDMLVKKRGYLHEQDLIELYALCQILPGPTSTQTITSIGFKMGGPSLAYLTLLVWITPAVSIMITLGIMMTFFQKMNISLDFLNYIQPIAVGIVAYSAYRITSSVVSSKTGFFLMIIATLAAFIFRTPFAFPLMILIGGSVTAFKFKKHQPVEEKGKIKINWSNFILWISVLIFAAILGKATHFLPIRLFENFYRNGSLIFGGGQVLVPLLYTEFVEFKHYLTSQEFLSGYGFVQALPGPVFSFSAYVGAISMKDSNIMQIFGGLMAAAGVFLPGTFLIYFVIRFWEDLKKYRIVRASLEGINAVSAGMVIAATFFLLEPVEANAVNYLLMIGTAFLLFFTKIPTPVVVIVGLITGIILR